MFFSDYYKTTVQFLHLTQNQRVLNDYFPNNFKVTTNRCCFNSRFKANNTMFASDTKQTFYERLFSNHSFNFQSDNKYHNEMFASDTKQTFYKRLF